ncbi:hypothetical protein Q5C_07570 [Leuconostoc pseudomesenteroides 4882]|nr:hypothetical protein Q5C_07570 [Leuconostoc pseudomesenteroides 4882]
MFDVGRIFSFGIVILAFLSQSNPKFVFIWLLLYAKMQPKAIDFELS